ncbi:MAG: NADH-quinone oxidoreductase subunit, partial [bacterium]
FYAAGAYVAGWFASQQFAPHNVHFGAVDITPETPGIHISPWLLILVGALFAGLLEIPGVTHAMRNFLEPTIPARLEATNAQELGTSALAVALALVGLFAAHVLWGRRSETPRRIAASTAPLERILQDKFGFDRLYDWAFYRPAEALARGGQRVWERNAVLGSMKVVESAGSWTSKLLSSAQSGLVRVYALAMAIGIAALAAWLITGAS